MKEIFKNETTNIKKNTNSEKYIKNNTKNKISIPILIFRIISVIIIIIALYYLYQWHLENKNNNTIIDDVRSQVTYIEENSNSDNNKENLLLDFSEFLEANEDTVAWVEVKNTDIDFPVVKSADNEFYLKHNFYKKNNSAGWIFADYRNKFDSTDKNIIIYGHNRRDGSMFSTLNKTLDESWYTNADNQIITLYTPSETAYYKIFSICKINATFFDNSIEFSTDEDFNKYIDTSLNNSIFDFSVDISSEDKILTLYTCANNNQYRIIVQAKKIVN